MMFLGYPYVLCNPRFPGVMLALNVADSAQQPETADNSAPDQQNSAPTVVPGETIGQVVATPLTLSTKTGSL